MTLSDQISYHTSLIRKCYENRAYCETVNYGCHPLYASNTKKKFTSEYDQSYVGGVTFRHKRWTSYYQQD